MVTASTRPALEDLALLCANCHRIIHSCRPWLSLDELRAIIRQ
jgi:5-methylcytosine-specific restriction protein A